MNSKAGEYPNDAAEIVLSYLFEMWTCGRGATLTADDVDVLMGHIDLLFSVDDIAAGIEITEMDSE